MPPAPPKSLPDFVNFAIAQGLRGRQIDTLVCAYGVNVLDPAKPLPFLSIQVSPAAFEYLQDGKTGIVGMNWTPRFVSIYPPAPDSFPIARVYQFPVPDVLEFAQIAKSFEERRFGLKLMFPDEFEMIVGAKGHEERIAAYCEGFWGRAEGFSSLAHGRLASTNVEESIILNSKGCMRCGGGAGLVTTTVGSADGGKGLMIGFYLCEEHLREADAAPSYFQHLCNILGGPVPITAGRLSFDIVVDIAAKCLNAELCCQIEKISPPTFRKRKSACLKEVAERTITAVRPSGFKVIVKLRDDGGYAYMVQDANGFELARIDNSDDWDVPFGPDHLHRSPAKDNKDVIPSFTYGLPQMDTKIILRILNQHGG